jgi:hypothetical protein
MDTPDGFRELTVEHEGQVVCSAEVTLVDEGEPAVRVTLHSESGHIPPGSRVRLVDDVLALPELQGRHRVCASVPRGDDESLHRLQERCEQVLVHSAGVSMLVEARLRSGEGTAVS